MGLFSRCKKSQSETNKPPTGSKSANATPQASREPSPAPTRASAGETPEKKSFLQRISSRRSSREIERQKNQNVVTELTQENAKLKEEVSRLEAELAAARTGEVGQLQAHVFQLHQYGEEAARRLHESEQARREADNMHRLKLQLLVDMWAASLLDAQGSTGRQQQIDVRGSLAKSLQDYSKISEGLSDISLRDSAQGSF